MADSDNESQGGEQGETRIRTRAIAMDAAARVKKIEDTAPGPRISNLEAELFEMRDQLLESIANQKRLSDDLALVKSILAASGNRSLAKLKVREPEPYDGQRDDKILENYFWDVEEYLSNMTGLNDEAQ
ncbi:hypothetical protein KI387_000403, partial [Taxus chinensis]